MKRIICIGNRYAPEDAAGPAVYDRLAGNLPPGVEVVDGGLAGLDLLRLVEGAERVVFVDGIRGFGMPGEVLVLEADKAAAVAGAFSHSAGLAYLLRVLPAVCESRLPEIRIVGIEGPPCQGAVERAAALALRIAGKAS